MRCVVGHGSLPQPLAWKPTAACGAWHSLGECVFDPAPILYALLSVKHCVSQRPCVGWHCQWLCSFLCGIVCKCHYQCVWWGWEGCRGQHGLEAGDGLCWSGGGNEPTFLGNRHHDDLFTHDHSLVPCWFGCSVIIPTGLHPCPLPPAC